MADQRLEYKRLQQFTATGNPIKSNAYVSAKYLALLNSEGFMWSVGDSWNNKDNMKNIMQEDTIKNGEIGPGNGLVLRLIADMFRQHADLFDKQAMILERVAKRPRKRLSRIPEEEASEMAKQNMLQQRKQ